MPVPTMNSLRVGAAILHSTAVRPNLETKDRRRAKRGENMRGLSTIPGRRSDRGGYRADPGSRWAQIRPSLHRLAGTDAKAPSERWQGAAPKPREACMALGSLGGNTKGLIWRRFHGCRLAR